MKLILCYRNLTYVNVQQVLTLLLRFDDKMNRQLSTNLTTPDEVQTLTQDLVQLGFINKEDWSMVDQVSYKDSVSG